MLWRLLLVLCVLRCAAWGDLRAAIEQDMAAGRFESAVAKLEPALAQEPAWREGRWNLAVAYYQLLRFEDAAAQLRLLRDRGPAQPGPTGTAAEPKETDHEKGSVLALLGMCEVELANYGAGASNLEQALTLGIPAPLHLAEPARYMLALADLKLRRFDSARLVLQALPTNSGDPELAAAYGLAAAHIPILPAQMKQALSPGDAALVATIGRALLLAKGDAAEQKAAAGIFEDIFLKYPERPYLHEAYAAILLDQSRFEEAARQLRAELNVDHRSYAARLGFCYLGLQTGLTADTVQYAKQAVTLQPDAWPARLCLAQVLLVGGHPEDALSHLEQARRLAPRNPEVHFSLGRAYRAVGREEDAIAEFKEFQRLNRH